MTAAGTSPDAYKEVCMVGITHTDAGTEFQFGAMTEDISAMDWGDKDIEGAALINGGRVAKWTPQADESITLKLYPVSALVDNTGAAQWMHPQATPDATQPIVADNTRLRNTHRLVLLWASTLPASAGAAITAASTTSYRIQVVNAYMTSYKPSFDDKTFMAEVTFKWTPFNKAGVANKREESCDGSADLPAAGTSTISLAS